MVQLRRWKRIDTIQWDGTNEKDVIDLVITHERVFYSKCTGSILKFRVDKKMVVVNKGEWVILEYSRPIETSNTNTLKEEFEIFE